MPAKPYFCSSTAARPDPAVRARAGAGAPPGALGSAWRQAATAVFVSLAWLPMMLPLGNRLPDLAAVYLRLFLVR